MQKSNQFYKALNQFDVTLRQARKQLEDVRLFYDACAMEYACDKSLEMAATVEKAVLISRSLPAHIGHPKAAKIVEEVIKNNVPVEIGFTEEGWFSVRIPMLLPVKEKGSSDYIRGFLYPAMRDFFMGKQPVRYTDCVLIFRHVYDRQRPERQYRDHDNFEINFVTDTVALYVMPDDGPKVCTHYYCSASSFTERTEVYVVPKSDFKKWFDMEPSIPDKGVLLYGTKP